VSVKDRRRALRARIRPGQSWYKISNSAGVDGPAEVAIYDEIGWFGITAESFLAELREISASEIALHINSPGGEIFDGIAIHNVLRSHSARVTVYVDSLAASIASVIAMAGDRVIMQPHSQLMIHDGSGLCVGNAADMREMADLLDRQSDNIAAVYAERAGGTVRQWRQRMRDETWYSAAEAVEAGLADEVAKLPRRDDMSNDWDLSMFRYAGRAAAPAPSDAAPATVPEAADAGRDAPAPTGQAPVPEPDPQPVAPLSAGEGPAPASSPEPAVVPPLDGDLFRSAVERAAVPVPFDADEFRVAMATLAADAPAVPPPAPEPEPEREPVPEPEPEPEPGPGEVLAETVALLAAEAPAVPASRVEEPAPPPEPEPPPVPEPAPDPWVEMAQIFHAGVELASANAPAPRAPEPDPGPEPEPYDPVLVQRALKEAMK
jgi:ATP-dependent protease ClpP protease subunit